MILTKSFFRVKLRDLQWSWRNRWCTHSESRRVHIKKPLKYFSLCMGRIQAGLLALLASALTYLYHPQKHSTSTSGQHSRFLFLCFFSRPPPPRSRRHRRMCIRLLERALRSTDIATKCTTAPRTRPLLYWAENADLGEFQSIVRRGNWI